MLQKSYLLFMLFVHVARLAGMWEASECRWAPRQNVGGGPEVSGCPEVGGRLARMSVGASEVGGVVGP